MWIRDGILIPAVSGDYEPDVGILLQVGIVPGGTIQATQSGEANGSSVEVIGAGAQGLIDTGASKTSVSPKLARALNLRPNGKVPIRSVTATVETNSYAVDIVLTFGTHSAVIENLEVCELDLGSAPFDVLIGRDILCRGVLTMDFAGRFTFSI